MDHSEPLFVEVRQLSKGSKRPDRIEVWTSAVEPQHCRTLLKALSAGTPRDEHLSHLKRVKRGQSKKMDDNSSPPKKKARVDLEIILGRRKEEFEGLVETFNLQPQQNSVPGRQAESKQELEEFNKVWPTIYFHKNTEEHKEIELALSKEEIQQMEHGMKLVMDTGGAIILNPSTGAVASSSCDEMVLQTDASLKNPLLCTPVLLALQGISRIERKAALGHGMESNAFRNGQYLCTGYDMYLKTEPNVFEAMALVHSRIRRVVFGRINKTDGGVGGTGEGSAVHCLPGTNHSYRAFFHPSFELATEASS